MSAALSPRGVHSNLAFLRLVRAPNVLSVPGDPLAGLFLAAAAKGMPAEVFHGIAGLPWTAVAAVALASVAAYAGGMVDNDLADLGEDRVERPERPLPSGEIPLSAAKAWRTLFLGMPFLFGLAANLPATWFAVHGLLMAAILSYNRTKDRMPRSGFVTMGLCRGLSFLSGAATLGPPGLRSPVILAAFAAWTAYIAALTAFAATENRRGPGRVRYLLTLPLALLVLLRLIPGLPDPATKALGLAGVLGAVWAALHLKACGPGAAPATARRTVGLLIRVLFPLQACACLASPAGLVPALLLLVLWFTAHRLARRIAAS